MNNKIFRKGDDQQGQANSKQGGRETRQHERKLSVP
ncbi:hypothetical protein DFA_10086 [Cavenderia fasciculata]|uniref:Uncharacterized protein n=1 Tax=Cavenderia fasciculata TaxID=261658 RepID=F4Q983_CACFS|nr:uncharacterized protein DFA_10086 [Cavenderia fasciculata]EGG15252.1 hypothetical protein DFA_10086 [Cavenderia fasciculata]|eukprot:XP_004351972.1 hypothetical protein DFA_10086 [Cavenderia fasciculata]